MKRKARAIKRKSTGEWSLEKLVKAFGMLEKANFIFQTRFASRSNFAAKFFRLGLSMTEGMEKERVRDNRFCKYQSRRRNRIFMGILVFASLEKIKLYGMCMHVRSSMSGLIAKWHVSRFRRDKKVSFRAATHFAYKLRKVVLIKMNFLHKNCRPFPSSGSTREKISLRNWGDTKVHRCTTQSFMTLTCKS